MSLQKTIFKDKTLSDVLEEIYTNSKKKDQQITALIGELKPLVENLSDATLVVPMIKEYLEIGVKNDNTLVQVASIVQRLETASARKGEEDMFDLEDIQDLLDQMEETSTEIEEVKEKQEEILNKDEED